LVEENHVTERPQIHHVPTEKFRRLRRRPNNGLRQRCWSRCASGHRSPSIRYNRARNAAWSHL